jgi:hypothetical protein
MAREAHMRCTITAHRRVITAVLTVTYLDLNNPRLTTISNYLADLGADARLIRSTKSVLGRRIKAAFAAAGLTRATVLARVKPARGRRSWLTRTPAYAPEQLATVAQVVADYPPTTHLAPTPADDPEALALMTAIEQASAKIDRLTRRFAVPASSWIEVNNLRADLDAAYNYRGLLVDALLDHYRAKLRPMQHTTAA